MKKISPYILLKSGEHFYFEYPELSSFLIDDIAHALSNICRFTGHVREFYSVAQHAVLTSHLVPQEHAFTALMHDAAEAFISDVAKPLKILLPEYQKIEERIEEALFLKHGIQYPFPQQVKDADMEALRMEMELLFGAKTEYTDITPMLPKGAYQAFMERYNELSP